MKILLVDDEEIMLEAIRMRIDWKKLGIREVYLATNTERARAICEEEGIDLMLCDIEMPGESGLALVSWAKVHCPETICLLLTGHAEFDYARQAVTLGAFEYLLKPVSMTKLEETLKKAGEELARRRGLKRRGIQWEKNRDIVVERFWIRLVLGQILGGRQELQDYLSRHGLELSLDIPYRLLLCCVNRESGAFSAFQEVELDFIYKNILAELFSYQEKKPVVLAVSPWQKLVLAEAGLEEKRIREQSEVFFQVLRRHFRTDGCFYVSKPCLPEEMGGIYGSLSRQAQKNVSWKNKVFQGEEEENGSNVVEKVKNYIRQHIKEDLSRDRIAQAVYLNPAYLSRVFRAQTGISLVDYMTREKIRQIQILLRSTDRSVSDIAGEFGYTNMPYFSQVFKKITGCSPLEYRKGR